ncbi:pleckstrin homology (PH) domain-containing protein [Actinidia rufa]|uniref:Pleckstrin homology (PH) domain-containing protein n=1 Tax=Actinidia rufa TaxID=165716 RepID=A0A7J0DWB7_9ERIC|nr:pleckstrin homology (PH) domain-containing protein [Actinidia rufa]
MLEDLVAYLLQRNLGNYVRGLNKETLKISVWKGAQEMGFTAFKAMSLGEVRSWGHVTWGCDFPGYFMQDQRSIGESDPCVKSFVLNHSAFAQPEVPWSRLGQDPVLVSLDRIFLLAKPATQVQGCSEDTIQEVKKSQIRDMEMKLLESRQVLKMVTFLTCGRQVGASGL